MKWRLLSLLSSGAPLLFCGGQGLAATRCEDIKQFHGGNATIDVAERLASPAAASPLLAKETGGFPLCRVSGTIAPTPDSQIRFEVWLPIGDKWNRKFQAVGNGGLSGALNYRAMLRGFNRGYATMTTDLGHTNKPAGAAEDASWALGHPEKIIDYAYRGTHLSTQTAKQLVAAFYGTPPTHSYFTGCSAGGIAGLNELLRFPRDYDGYVVGAATPDHLGQELAAMWNTLAASLASPADALRPSQIQSIHNTILRQCAGQSGGAPGDPFLSDPTACAFRPVTLECRPGQDAAVCLTPAQVAAGDKIYRGPFNPRTGAPIFSGLTPGTELGWDKYFSGKKNPVGTERPWAGFLVSMVYSDPNYLTEQKYLRFDFDKEHRRIREMAVASESFDSAWNIANRNLDVFTAAGGKVIQYHGWDDPNIPALEAIKLYRSVVADKARRHHLSRAEAEALTRTFYRLFMVPGMGHCSGGDGPSSFGQGDRSLKADSEHDTLLALEGWVERGIAPDKFIGARLDPKTSEGDMTRPICSWPKVPTWNGSGSTNDASSFTCAITSPADQRTTPSIGKGARS